MWNPGLLILGLLNITKQLPSPETLLMSETPISWLPGGEGGVLFCVSQWPLLEELLMVHTCPVVLHGSAGY